MLGAILVIIILLWILGYITIPGLVIPSITFFIINGHAITLWNVLLFAVIIWLIGVLPRPFREIASVLFIIWILATLGFFAIAWLSSGVVVVIILGVLILLLTGL